MREMYICVRSTNARLLHMREVYICESCTYARGLHMREMYICGMSTDARGVDMREVVLAAAGQVCRESRLVRSWRSNVTGLVGPRLPSAHAAIAGRIVQLFQSS